jgi:hypothetical protein
MRFWDDNVFEMSDIRKRSLRMSFSIARLWRTLFYNSLIYSSKRMFLCNLIFQFVQILESFNAFWNAEFRRVFFLIL